MMVKHSLILFILLVSPLASALIPIRGYVNDQADIFTPEEEAQITTLAEQLYMSGRVQYAVVTVTDLEGLSIEDYAIQIAQGKLGDTDADNGLLLLIALQERKYRFEVGLGLEGTLNDAKIGRVGRTYLVPAFQQEEYGRGVIAATQAIDQLTLGVEPAAMMETEQTNTLWIYILMWIAIIILSGISRYRRNRKYGDAAEVAAWIALGSLGGKGKGGGGFGGGGFGGGGAGGGW